MSYDVVFYDQINNGALMSARIILEKFYRKYTNSQVPESVVDVGCGEGAWLSVVKQFGTKRIRGIDGEHIDKARLLISSEDFYATDLSDPNILNEQFDLAISLEVAEHLPVSSADNFVKTLTSLSSVVLFSAAIPGQGGVNHINEQWPSYWSEKFLAYGYGCDDSLRWEIWNDINIETWYKQNILVFAKVFSSKQPLDVVHPDNWNYHYRGIR